MRKTTMATLFSIIQKENPLVHHMTNVVTINDCANVTLAVGASPVMATSIEEVEEMVHLAEALVINLGTIQPDLFDAMILAGKAANQKGIPVVVDPVGVGATRFRFEKAKELLREVNVAVIRGNASEVYSLIGGDTKTRGVDSGEITITRQELARQAARLFSCVVVVSGKVDVISNGDELLQIENGDSWLQNITGTGCMATSIIGSFSGITEDTFLASALGMSIMSLAGERAKRRLQEGEGIGMYKVRLMDEISTMNEQVWMKEVRLIES